jgi:hypothetical protein
MLNAILLVVLWIRVHPANAAVPTQNQGVLARIALMPAASKHKPIAARYFAQSLTT